MDRMLGFNSPISRASEVARTLGVSNKPRLDAGRIRPGYTCLPLAFTVVAPAGAVTLAPTAAIFPLVITMDAFSNTCPLPTCTVAFVMTVEPVCGGAG